MLQKGNGARMGGICAVIATKNTSEKKRRKRDESRLAGQSHLHTDCRVMCRMGTRRVLGVVVMGKVKQETIPDVDVWSEMLKPLPYSSGDETVTLKTYDQGQDCEQYEYTIKVDAWDDGDFWRVVSAVEDIWADDGEDKKRNMLVTLLNKDHAIALRDMLNKVLG